MEDRGNYVCTADNGVGSPDSKVVTLDVEFPPSIRVPRPRMPQAYGYEAKLVCKIEAFPPPSIFWRKDNESEAITSHGNYQISHFASQDDITTSTLTVRPPSLVHYLTRGTNLEGPFSDLWSGRGPVWRVHLRGLQPPRHREREDGAVREQDPHLPARVRGLQSERRRGQVVLRPPLLYRRSHDRGVVRQLI